MARETYTDCVTYAVATFGPDGTWTVPWFLRKGAKKKYLKNEEVLACHQFSGYLTEAELFERPNSAAAEMAAARLQQILDKGGNCLAKKVKVVKLFVKEI